MSQQQQQQEQSSTDYCRTHLPPDVLERLEAGAFGQLCRHLQERSDAVANIDLMTLSGFCRNCLSKWMVLEARKLVDQQDGTQLDPTVRQALDALGYEEAAQHVYGMTYGEWKKRHQKKATDEQMERYKASEPIQAKHDKALLETRGEKPDKPVTAAMPHQQQQQQSSQQQQTQSSGLLSDVCCQDAEQVATSTTTTTTPRTTVPSYRPPSLPRLVVPARIAVLTVSDRAAADGYATGDLSGPAVETTLRRIDDESSSCCRVVAKAIVPDDARAIQDQLVAWSSSVADIILTTGGTGLAARDVTPEATRAVLSTECAGLMHFCVAECSRLHQPLASLTRGTAGIIGGSSSTTTGCLVANLPGNPQAVGEILPLLLPLLLHAHQDMLAGSAAAEEE